MWDVVIMICTVYFCLDHLKLIHFVLTDNDYINLYNEIAEIIHILRRCKFADWLWFGLLGVKKIKFLSSTF